MAPPSERTRRSRQRAAGNDHPRTPTATTMVRKHQGERCQPMEGGMATWDRPRGTRSTPFPPRSWERQHDDGTRLITARRRNETTSSPAEGRRLNPISWGDRRRKRRQTTVESFAPPLVDHCLGGHRNPNCERTTMVVVSMACSWKSLAEIARMGRDKGSSSCPLLNFDQPSGKRRTNGALRSAQRETQGQWGPTFTSKCAMLYSHGMSPSPRMERGLPL